MRIGEHASLNSSRESHNSAREESLTARAAENRAERQARERAVVEARTAETAEVVKSAGLAREAMRQSSEQAARAAEQRRRKVVAQARADAETTAAEIRSLISETMACAANAS